jgi:hypothetical protein
MQNSNNNRTHDDTDHRAGLLPEIDKSAKG